MDASMTIQEFNTLLESENKDNELIEALGKLRAIESPEEILGAAADSPLSGWSWY